MTPRERWEAWQREKVPTAGARMPLHEYLFTAAQHEAHDAFIAEARGEPVPPTAVDTLWACARDLAALARERGAL